LIELGDACPKLYRPVFANVLTVMVSIAKDKSFDDRTRQTALELLLTLSEAAPPMARKTPNFASEIIPVAMEMITDIEDDESWYTTDDVGVYITYIRILTNMAFIYSWKRMITRKTMLWVKVHWIELLVLSGARQLFLLLSNISLKCFNLENGNNVVLLSWLFLPLVKDLSKL
jgi:hypothetical protein